MAEFWVISNFLREKCEENTETQHLCQEIATQYTESQKLELRGHFAHEENLRLKIEVGNLESMSNCASDSNEAQSELDALLHECYKEHLQVCFDMDECEMEKLYSYDSIKSELDSSDTIHFYQQLYLRKIKTATKMESRNIVKKYRQKEQELLKTRDALLIVEKSLQELEDKVKKRQQELHKLIYRLVKGSKELEIIYSRPKSRPYGSHNIKDVNSAGTMERSNTFHKPLHKGGLSARLSLDLHKFAIPSASVIPRIRNIDPTQSRNRLLQQAANLRKAMQRSPIVLTDVEPIPKLSSILKLSTESATPPKAPRKTVSFEKDPSQTISITSTTSNTFLSCNQKEIDAVVSGTSSDFDMKQNLEDETKEKEKQRIQIIENIVLKPPDVLQPVVVVPHLSVESNLHCKRKMKISDDKNIFNSPPKIKRCSQDTDKPDTSTKMGSKNFMDMFLELSDDTTTSSVEEHKTNDKQIEVQVESTEETSGINDQLRENKKDDKTKSFKHKKSFEDFEDFVSGFANTSSDDINKNQLEAELSFDFGCDNDGGDAGSDNFSLNF